MIDSRLTAYNAVNDKLPTNPYDSDHNAIAMLLDTTNAFGGLSPANLTIGEINEYIAKLEDTILNAIDAVVPISKRRIRKGCLRFVNTKIKKLHKYKSKLITALAKIDRQELVKEFRRAESSYWEALAKDINFRDPNKFFQNISSHFRHKEPPHIDDLLIDRNNNLYPIEILGPEPATIVNDKIRITQPSTKLNVIGKYFKSINSPRYTNNNTETKRKADEAANSIKAQLHNNRITSRTHTTFSVNNRAFSPIADQIERAYFHSHLEVRALLKTAKNKTSCGLDKIPMIVLKYIPTELIMDITTIFNNCLNHSYYPERWKRAKINIMEHVENNNIIPDNQYGFKSSHSTTHAIHKFASDLNKYLLNSMLIGTVLLDLEKAFDSVWLNGLIYILLERNFQKELILLIYDMLHWKSFVVWNGTLTSSLTFWIREGLQQETVTAPILFNIYNSENLNLFDLNSGNQTLSSVYVDDLVVYVADRKIPIIQQKLEKIINDINTYYKLWNLRINPTKSETILFRKTVNEISPLTVPLIKDFSSKISDINTDTSNEIPRKDLVKYLGINFDYLLRMNKHHTIQLDKAKKAFRANAKIFYNRHMEHKAKLICY
ncbi:PREDICTED: uncharacterized protein LOC107068640 [Polistes dominula]|uniref:Uncharacterized protein LOC107068640 n=1 Tax=Polistes dominula TaxID=743375 RepID=A0ABM1IKM8_POLDO|nr:PREDICTED: uncharacterized protein LOC107068640 [Polistes dominula]